CVRAKQCAADLAPQWNPGDDPNPTACRDSWAARSNRPDATWPDPADAHKLEATRRAERDYSGHFADWLDGYLGGGGAILYDWRRAEDRQQQVELCLCARHHRSDSAT